MCGLVQCTAQMWEERFLNIMEQCMPTITVSPRSNLPLLSLEKFSVQEMQHSTGKTHWSPKPSEEEQGHIHAIYGQQSGSNSLDTSDCKALWKTNSS